MDVLARRSAKPPFAGSFIGYFPSGPDALPRSSTMHDVFDSIRGLLKVNSLSVDNKIFQLHYKVTMFFLLACSLLVTQRQYFGDPIDCIVETVDQEVMDTYCWIHATFTIPEMNGAIVGHEVAHPGIANPNVPGEEKREIKHHKYYQWVTLVLALQVGSGIGLWRRVASGSLCSNYCLFFIFKIGRFKI